METNADDRTTRARRRRGVRTGWLLVAVAAVPLTGVGFMTSRLIGEVNDARAAAARTEELAERAVTLTELDGALFDEMVWSASIEIGDSIGVPSEIIATFTGGDATIELPRAMERTDELVVRLGHLRIEDTLARTRRADAELQSVLGKYGDLAQLVDAELEWTLSELLDVPGARVDDLRGAVDVLELGIRARNGIADGFYGYFATIFDFRGTPQEELLRLVAAVADFRTALDAIEETADVDPVLADALAVIESDPAIAEFVGAIDRLVDQSLAAGLPATGQELSLTTATMNLDGFAAAYQAGTRAGTATVELLDTAAGAVLDAATEVSESAERTTLRAYGVVALLSLMTLVAALIATRYVVRPLRDLQRAADHVRTGEPFTPTAPGGPSEVRAAARAIRDASAHLDLVGRQAQALAEGELDAAVLNEPAPSSLGAALHRTVATLRSALARQEDFRRRLAHEASHDGLTQLPNRAAAMSQLATSLARTTRAGNQLAVLFIDLDRFKDVNDLHGHQAGDLVLTTVADRLLGGVRDGDHVGRLGGDEFLVVAEPIGGIDDAIEIARRLLGSLSAPIEIGTTTFTVGASIGIAIADGADLTADELLRDADLAVYRAKEAGRGGLAICDEDLRKQLADTADLAVALRRAIELDELVLHYQPIIGTRDTEVHALEALVRWRRPGHEQLVMPGDFIDFAERSDLIVDIDRWVIGAVALQLAEWQRGPTRRTTPVAINVSGRHLGREDFAEHVLAPLRDHGVDPRLVIVEVTESALLEDLGTAALQLRALRESGVQVAIDDFGTGYSSLAHLRSLPVDIVKIDRSFTVNAIRDEHEASIVKLIIDTGHALGATITAEGVETAEEAARLTELGSDTLQGFYFARPRAAADLAVADTVQQR